VGKTPIFVWTTPKMAHFLEKVQKYFSVPATSPYRLIALISIEMFSIYIFFKIFGEKVFW